LFFSIHHKSFKLRHEDIHFQVSIQWSGLHIHLMKFSFILSSHEKFSMNGRTFCSCGEILLIINTFFLCKYFFYKPRCVLFKWDILFVLGFEDPLTTNWFGSKWKSHQLSHPILHERIISFFHGLFPLIMRSFLFKEIWLKVSR